MVSPRRRTNIERPQQGLDNHSSCTIQLATVLCNGGGEAVHHDTALSKELVMLTDFVVASPEEAAAVSASLNRRSDWACFESKGLDNSTLAALWSAIDPSVDASALEGEAHVVFSGPDRNGPWVFDLPTHFVRQLAALPRDSFLPVAERWVKSPELSHARWRGSDVVPAIVSLNEIASIAIQKEKALLLWMSL